MIRIDANWKLRTRVPRFLKEKLGEERESVKLPLILETPTHCSIWLESMFSKEGGWTFWSCQFCFFSGSHIDRLMKRGNCSLDVEEVSGPQSTQDVVGGQTLRFVDPTVSQWCREVHTETAKWPHWKMRIIKEVRNSRRGNEDSAHLGPLVHGHYPTAHREYGELPRSFGGLMWVVFPRSLFASPYVSFSVV